jgi:superfamily I DNA and/or RNA helicase
MEEQTTYWNEAEAQCVLGLVKELVERDVASPIRLVSSIGVISPYSGQVQLIKSIIASDAKLRRLLRSSAVSIEVKSVDGYQGRERDVIILSTVRSNRNGGIGFLRDWRRLNVALTRAKLASLIVGDLDTLSESDRHWSALTRWALSARCIVNDYDDAEDEPSV